MTAVPATNGVLRTDLKSMKIGDYIVACTIMNNNLMYKIGSKSYDTAYYTNEKAIAVTDQLDKTNLWFYMIKVANGLLISDRNVFNELSRQRLNRDNMLKGNFRIVTNAEWYNYVLDNSLNGNIIPGDNNVWHYDVRNPYTRILTLEGTSGNTSSSFKNKPQTNSYSYTLANGTAMWMAYEYVDNEKSTNIYY